MNANEISIDEYVLANSTPESRLLAELNRETNLKTIYPRMLSGPVLGKFLEFVSYMIKPKYILEIGTFTGYSAICMAKSLKEGAQLITIDKNDEIAILREKYFQKTNLADKIKILTGDAIQIIPKIDNYFDLVFIDADKNEYVDYYKLIIDKVNPGGFILADNVLWDGKVLDKEKNKDKETRGIIAFNEYVLQDECVENIILPFRDGVNVIRKI